MANSSVSTNKWAVFSLTDTTTVLNHPDIGQITLSNSENGGGQVSISYNTDLASMTQTASGFAVINKIVSHAGSVTFEVAQNSNNDKFLQTFIDSLENTVATSRFASGTLDITDAASGFSIHANGVIPQKRPDRAYSQQSGTLQYTFLCAEINQDGGLLPTSKGKITATLS